MKQFLLIGFTIFIFSHALAQIDSIIIPEPETLDLQFLIAEAMLNNPDIQASLYQMDVMEAKVSQAGALDDPELRYMREELPGFQWSEAMYSNLELMQMLRFPTKLATQSKLAEIRAEHAHHDHLEKINEVLARLKSAYYELWFIQQNIVLIRENARLMKQFAEIARTKYSVGETSQQDVLKAQVEQAMLSNQLTSLRQQELSAKAMLIAILNRAPNDTLGFAVIPEEVISPAPLDSLFRFALLNRSMLKHDSLMISESSTELSLAKQEYIPDFKFGLQYVTRPVDDFRGWTVTAGITLPFAPWTLGKASARVEEANAAIKRSEAQYNASKNMVLSNVKDFYYKTEAGKRQLDTYRMSILPQARQSLSASQAAYQTGKTDFLMLIDSYRTLVDLTVEYFMVRMQYDQSIAEIERAVGAHNIFYTK